MTNVILYIKYFFAVISPVFVGYVPVYFLLLRRKSLGPGGKSPESPEYTDLSYKNPKYSSDWKDNTLECKNKNTDIEYEVEYKGQEYSLEYESLSGRFFIAFISFYIGFFIITNFMVILCLVRIPLRETFQLFV